MITVEKTASVKSAGIQETVSFGIKQDGLAHIFNVLRNQLYSDKILAVMREYSANALDANVEAGNGDVPIVVTLPNALNLNFKVRDRGFGLSDEDIKEIYAFYGESTKRKSNALIGQLGLGSKSAFAYGDNFVINSFVRGVKNTYNAFIDDSQVGQIAKLNSEKTTEHDGVEIVIGVRREDIGSFAEKAASLFQHFKVKPQILGATINFQKNLVELSGKDWEVYNEQRDAIVVMGNIAYPTGYSFLNCSDEDTRVLLTYSGLVIKFEIGELDVAANRESLQYTKRTIEAVKSKLKKVKTELTSQLLKKCTESASLFEAKRLYGEIFMHNIDNSTSALYRFSRLIKGVTWQGVKIDDCRIVVTGANTPNHPSVRLYKETYRGSKIKSEDCPAIVCSHSRVLVHNDKHIKSGIKNRIQDLILNQKNNVYVVSASDADFKKLLNDTGLVQENFIKMSSLVAAPSTPRGKSLVTTLAKPSGQEFILDVAGSGTKYYTICSSFWKECDVDFEKDSGVYLEIFRFEYKTDDIGRFGNPYYLLRNLGDLNAIGITIPKIYGFKSDSVKLAKANKNFISFSDYVKAEIQKAAKKEGIGEAVADCIEYNKNRQDWWNFASFSSRLADKNGLFFDAIKQISKNKRSEKVVKFVRAADTFGVSLDSLLPSYDAKKLNSVIAEKYPAVEYFKEVYSDDSKENRARAIINYIDAIDQISQQV